MWTGIHGKRDAALAQSAEFKAVAETYKKLQATTSMPARPAATGTTRPTLVIQGKAGMQIMGDWAKGEFIAAGQTPGKEYGCTVLSNGSGGYVMGGDVFVFPKTEGPDHHQGADDAGEADADARDADRVRAKKGSIPVRRDVDTSARSTSAPRRACADVADKAQQMPSGDMLAPPATDRRAGGRHLAILEHQT